jgi:hypothetical protein
MKESHQARRSWCRGERSCRNDSVWTRLCYKACQSYHQWILALIQKVLTQKNSSNVAIEVNGAKMDSKFVAGKILRIPAPNFCSQCIIFPPLELFKKMHIHFLVCCCRPIRFYWIAHPPKGLMPVLHFSILINAANTPSRSRGEGSWQRPENKKDPEEKQQTTTVSSEASGQYSTKRTRFCASCYGRCWSWRW